MIRLEAIISLALYTLQVHLHGGLLVVAVLVAVGSLLEEVLCLVLSVLFVAEQVGEEATFEGAFCFAAEVNGSGGEICHVAH